MSHFIQELFTHRFIKDLIFSIVFILIVYGLTHNPIVQPMPQPMPGNWSIQVMQHALYLGLAGHNYLALRNQDGTIIAELHGLATDPKTGTWRYFGTNGSEKLRVWKFDGPRYFDSEVNFPGVVLTEGASSTMSELWKQAGECADKINTKDISYPPYGVNITGITENSNSVAYTIADCMGFDVKHIGIFTPGERVNLLR
jgi:hypothetical protein